MKKWIAVTVAVATFALAVLVYAQVGPPERRMPRGERPFAGENLIENRELIDQLNLGEDQVQALKDMHLEARKATVELRAQQELAELDLKAQLESDTPEIEKVMDIIERVGRTRTEIQKHQVRAMLQTREILGPEAFAQLKELRRDRVMERVEQRRDRMAERRDGPPRERMEDGARRWPGPRPDPDRPRWDGPPPRGEEL